MAGLPLFFQKLKKYILFLLFLHKDQVHRVIGESLSALHVLIVVYACLFIGVYGFLVWSVSGFLGLMLYYLLVAIGVLEALHVVFDK